MDGPRPLSQVVQSLHDAMNISKVALTSVMVLLGCASPRSQRNPNSAKASEVHAGHEHRLFLHLLEPPSYTDPTNSAHRIITARIFLSEYFAISAGDDDPFTNGWNGAVTFAQLSKTGVPQARPLEPFWNSGDAILAGRIDAVKGKFIAQLQGRSHTSLNYAHGEIELEKPVYAQGCLFREAIWGAWFVLSTNSDCGHFLKALDDRTLQPPGLVDMGSPTAKAWPGQKAPQGTALQILDAEPVAPPNAARPQH